MIVVAMLLLIPPTVTPPIVTASPDASSCRLLLPPQYTSLFLSLDSPSGALYATPAPGAPAPSSPKITAVRYDTPANGSGQGEEEKDSDFSHAKLFTRASSSLLGLISVGVVIMAGMWMSDVGLWKPPEEAVGCSHCADVGAESHNKVQQADQKVLQVERAKQQFMAYVFHNIRGDIAKAPKCQMILVSSLDC